MPVDVCLKYYRCMDRLRAREMLDMVFVSDLPHLKDSKRSEKIDYLQQRAEPRAKRVLRMDELVEKIRGL